MKRRSILLLITVIIALDSAFVSACPLQPPLKSDVAGSESCFIGQTVTLDGEDKFTCIDAGQITEYRWVLPSQAYCIEGDTASQVQCKFSPAGTYEVELQVKCSHGIWNTEHLNYPASNRYVYLVTVQAGTGTWYVKPDGSDAFNGQSWEDAFRTIQTAIDSASDGEQIIVKSGTSGSTVVYYEQLDLKGKSLTIRSDDPDNWEAVKNTLIDAGHHGTAVLYRGDETGNMKGFTIAGGAPAGDGPALHLELDETAGAAAVDSSGKERDGSLFFTDVPIWADGRLAGALQFDGDDYVEIPDFRGIVGRNSRTVCAWVKTSGNPASSMMVATWGSLPDGQKWAMRIDSNEAGQLAVGVSGGYIRGQRNVADGKWHHVAVVLEDDGSPDLNEIKLYVDGVRETQTTIGNCSGSRPIDTSPAETVIIGARTDGTGYANYYQGLLDDLRIYGRALNAEEVESLADAKPQWLSPVFMSELDDAQGNQGRIPCLSLDKLTMYFSRFIPSLNCICIVQAVREVPYGPFTNQRVLTELVNSQNPMAVNSPWISADGQRLYYHEAINLAPVETILKMAEWSESQNLWVPAVKTFTELHYGAGYTEALVSLTADELDIFWQTQRPGGAGSLDIWTASRATTEQPFGNIRPLSEINTIYNDGGPCISPDGLTLYFHATYRAGGDEETTGIYKATRSSLSEAFGNVTTVEIPGYVNLWEHNSYITPDKTALYYQYSDAGGIYFLESVQAAGLVAHLKLDNNLDDSSLSASYSGVWSGTPDYSDGYQGRAITLDGSSYVEISGFKGITGGNSRTSTAWINIGDVASMGAIMSWGSNSTGSADKWFFRVEKSTSSNLYRFGVGLWGGYYVWSDYLLSPSRWHHVTACLDGTNLYDIKLYLDGDEISYYNRTADVALNTAQDEPVHLGAHLVNGSMGHFFKGRIDEARIYSRALTASEIRKLADLQPRLAAHWKLDGNADDSAANPHHGTVQISPVLWEEGMCGQALRFDGTEDYVEVTGYKGISGAKARSVAAWIKANPNVDQNQVIVSWGETATGKYWKFWLQKNAGIHGSLCVGISGGYYVAGSTDLRDGKWHHVMAVMEEGANVEDIQLYVDGKLETLSAKNTYVIQTGGVENVHIGCETNKSNYFSGMIDDVRIYNYALERGQIQSLCNMRFADGGGIRGLGASAAVDKCIIEYNISKVNGGGAASVNGAITNCYILNNRSAANGGAMAECNGDIINCVIAENTAEKAGALSGGSGDIINCTIAHNIARNSVGGVMDYEGETIVNTIVWGNSDGDISTDMLEAQIFNCLSAVAYSCIQGSTAEGNCYPGTGNINRDPLLSEQADRKWYLSTCSSCIGKGCDSPSTLDIYGTPRTSGYYDIGAYAWEGTVWYVDGNRAESGNGISWATAFMTIQEGIDDASNGDIVLVADGIYTGGGNRDIDFYGKAITVRSFNGPDVCIIDCQGTAEEPHRGFYFHSGEGNASVLSGLTIQNGYGEDSVNYNGQLRSSGGGIFILGVFSAERCSPTIRNCVIKDNISAFWGGGIWGRYSNAVIEGCSFVHNKAGDTGGAIYMIISDYIIRNCHFADNEAGGSGGALWAQGSISTIENCIVERNKANKNGGGFKFNSDPYPLEGQKATILGCKFYGNATEAIDAANQGGGALDFYLPTAEVTNCVFAGNVSDNLGGAIRRLEGSTVRVVNCSFSDNTANNGASIVVLGSQGDFILNNSILWNTNCLAIPELSTEWSIVEVNNSNINGGDWTGETNISIDPLFARNPSPGVDGVWGTIDDDYGDLRLYNTCSPCIDTGGNNWVLSDIREDIDGNPRFRSEGDNILVDMGAYEFQNFNQNQPPYAADDPGTCQEPIPCGSSPIIIDVLTNDCEPEGDVVWVYSISEPTYGSVMNNGDSVTYTPNQGFSGIDIFTYTATDGVNISNPATVTIFVNSSTYLWLDAGVDRTIPFDDKAGLVHVQLDATIRGFVPDTGSVNWSETKVISGGNYVIGSISDEKDPDVTVTISGKGVYVFNLQAAYLGQSLSDTVVITVTSDPISNSLPQVQAWAEDSEIVWPNAVRLYGRVSDDGLPAGFLEAKWEKHFGPLGSHVTFGQYTIGNMDTTAKFSTPGMYVLKLSATDVFGDDSHTVERFVEVKAGTGVTVENNTPPVVNAGPNLSIVRSPMSTFSYTFSEAAVHDDTPTGVLNVHWYIVSGPEGGMRFNDSSAVNPVVTFFKTGTYLLQLSADDSEYCVSDEVAITVEETPSALPAINVYAGPDKEIKQPASALLTEASITDSDTGEPYPLEEVRLSWSKVSGPGQVRFEPSENPDQPETSSTLNPSVFFTTPGEYVLELAAETGQQRLYDQIKIVVKSGVRIGTSTYGSYFIDENNTVWAAGGNLYGQLGNGTAGIDGTDQTGYGVPYMDVDWWRVHYWYSPVSTENKFSAVAGGHAHAFGADFEGKLYAWGLNEYGQLGIAETGIGYPIEPLKIPVQVLKGHQDSSDDYLCNVVSISSGSTAQHTLVSDMYGHVWSWGHNHMGQLGVGTFSYGESVEEIFETEPSPVGSPSNVLDAYYKFDFDYTITMDHYNIAVARDSSGNLYSAIKYGDDDNSNDGIGGSNSACLKLTGNDYLGNNQEFENMVVGYHGISGNEPRSISFWAKPLVEGSDIFCEGPVIAWGDTIENGALWIISIDEGCVTVHVDDAHLIQSVPVVFQEDTWYHVVVVLPQNAGQLGDIQIYCAVQDSDCVQLGTSCTNEQTAIRTGNNNYLQIGKGYEVNGAGFRGYLDEIQIYRKALSDTEIAYLHRNPQFSLPIANIKEVSAGSYHSLLLENIQEGDASCQGRVYSFGENWYRAYDNGERYCGKLGLGVCPIHQVSGYCEENSVRELPCCVVGSEQGMSYLENIIAVSAGMYHSMALEKYIDGDDTYKGYVYTWGWNLSSLHRFSPYVDLPEMVNYGGRLGRYFQATEIDHIDNSIFPIKVYGPDRNGNHQHDSEEGYLNNIQGIAAGESHSMALDRNGHVWVWGDNQYGQLGIGCVGVRREEVYPTISDSCPFPVQVLGPDTDGDGKPNGYLGDQSKIIAIASGPWHCLALDEEGEIWGWGASWAIGCGYSNQWAVSIPKKIVKEPLRVQRISSETSSWYSRIQAAIDDAVDGDEIVVYPGTYHENIDFGDKSIVVRSTNPDDSRIQTSINGESGNPGNALLPVVSFGSTIHIINSEFESMGHYYWRFDDGAGITAIDCGSNNGFTATLNEFDENCWVKGKVNRGLKFDGNNDYVTTTSYGFEQSGTITAWIKMESGTAGINQSIISWGGSGPGQARQIGLYDDGLRVGLRVDINGNNDPAYVYSISTALDYDNWHHIAVVIDYGSDTEIHLYIDGHEESTVSVPSQRLYSASGATVQIGCPQFNTSSWSHFNGVLDEVQIFSDAKLSDTEIARLAKHPYRSGELCGITVSNGGGDGILCREYSSPSIRNCVISNHQGHGINSEEAVEIHNSRIVNNGISGIFIKAINNSQSSIRITNSHILNNPNHGININAPYAETLIQNNVICENGYANQFECSGVRYESQYEINRLDMIGNTIAYNGQYGLYFYNNMGSNPPQEANITNCILWENGDPITGNNIGFDVTKCAFSFIGKALEQKSEDVNFVNVFKFQEYSTQLGTNASVRFDRDISFYQNNDIIELNKDGIPRIVTGINNELKSVYFTPPLSSETVTYTHVRNWGQGDLQSSHNFVCDYHLESTSPCIDSGEELVPQDYALYRDIDNEARYIDGRVDIGADEYMSCRIIAGAGASVGLGETVQKCDADFLDNSISKVSTVPL